MKKKFSIIIITLLIAVLSITLASCYQSDGVFEYVAEEDGIHMKKYNDITSRTEVVIPDVIDGLDVVAMDDYSLSNTIYVAKITIGKNIETIAPYALNNNGALTEFIVHPENEHFKSVEGTLYTIDGKELVANPPRKDSVSHMEKKEEVFYDDEFIIPDGVEIIRENAFYHNNIKKIVFSDSVTFIGTSAFLRVYKLETVILSKNLEVISKDAFNNNGYMKEIVIHDKITSIERYAFFNCSSLIKVDITANKDDITFGDKWMPNNLGKKLDDLVVTIAGVIDIDNR